MFLIGDYYTVTITSLYPRAYFLRALNNRSLFHNKRYCGVAEKAVILHPIKFVPF